MQRQQKTLDSFLCGNKAEPESNKVEAQSMLCADSVDMGPYDNLMKDVIADDNIDMALKRVVGNRGAPGVDGMTVYELEPWLKLNREMLKDELESGRYTPRPRHTPYTRVKEQSDPLGGVSHPYAHAWSTRLRICVI